MTSDFHKMLCQCYPRRHYIYGDKIVSRNNYYILTKMGRMEEAKAALLHAKKDDERAIVPTETRAWIQDAMKKLGMTP